MDGERGFKDARTGKWIRGFEGVHRAHNRYGYETRVILRQRQKAKEGDLREQLQAARNSEWDLRQQLNRMRASSEEKIAIDCRQMKKAIRWRSAQRGSPPRPHVTSGRVHDEENRRKASQERGSRNRDRGRDASHRTGARHRSRSPRRDAAASIRSKSPGARDIYSHAQATQDGLEDNRVRRALLEEEKLMDEERRTLWLEEELRRTALLEEEEKRHQKRMEEDAACRKRQGEEDEERRRLFMMEITDVRETISEMWQEKLHEALKEIAPLLQSAMRKSSE